MFGSNTPSTPDQNPSPRISVIDDDRFAATVMRARLRTRFPDTTISIAQTPTIDPEDDVYFIDNDFNGHLLALKLLSKIREVNSNALVIVMSAKLDNDILKELLNSGCDAVYDKNDPRNSETAFNLVADFLSELQDREKK